MVAQNDEKPEFGKIQGFIAKKYNLALVRELINNPHGLGFNALAKGVAPITPRMLSARLKELEALKIIQKNLVLGAKPKIEYRATLKAESLRKAISELEKWGSKEIE
ncbi:MAG TPA: helix-turn-helix domain-containing protein [archaeon]|nr:helix-turn-helix domain-containing protein [archaeon]